MQLGDIEDTGITLEPVWLNLGGFGMIRSLGSGTPQVLNPKPEALSTPDPQPETLNPGVCSLVRRWGFYAAGMDVALRRASTAYGNGGALLHAHSLQ